MPKSKRNRIVCLAKVKKKSREGKGKHFERSQRMRGSVQTFFVFSTENFRSARLAEVCQHFKQNSRIFFAKNNLVAMALGKTAQDEQANELHKVSELLRGQSGLMFTNAKANEVQRYFAEHTEAEFAQSGAVAPVNVSLPAGPVPAEFHVHGAMEPQLRKLGMLTRLENDPPTFQAEFADFFAKNNLIAVALGKSAHDEQANELHKVSELLRGQSGLMFTNAKANEVQNCNGPTAEGFKHRFAIELLEEFTVCKTGDQLSADQARILKLFGHRLAQFCVRLLA